MSFDITNVQSAEALLASVDDPGIRRMMEFAYDEIKRCVTVTETRPASDFDLLFFMNVIQQSFNKRVTIARILAGEDLSTDWE